MRIVLVGATGVIGSPTVERLVASGHEVLAVSRREASDDVLRAQGAKPVRLDIFDPTAVRRDAEGTDAVVNLATHIPPQPAGLRRRAWEANDRLRRDASRVLAGAAIDVGARFLQESFAPTYADGGSEWITEDHPLDPVAQTDTVADAEASAASVTDAGGVGVVLRFGLFYGPHVPVVREWLASGRKGRFFLPGPPERYTSMIDVDDAAAAVEAALTLPPGRYNVVEDTPSTVGHQAQAMAEALGRDRVKPLPAFVGRFPMLRVVSRSHRISNERLRGASAWRPKVPNTTEGWQRIVKSVGIG